MEPYHITAILYGVPSLALFILAFLQFKEKGMPLHESCIFTSKKERDEDEYSKHYKHSAIQCLLISLYLLLSSLNAIFSFSWYHIVSLILIIFIIGFGIYSYIHITNQRRFK